MIQHVYRTENGSDTHTSEQNLLQASSATLMQEMPCMPVTDLEWMHGVIISIVGFQ